MKKKDWFISLAPLFFTWGLDRITKILAEAHIQELSFHGFFGLILHHNKGAMLGLFSDLPAVLRVVSLSTGGGFLLFTFIVIQYLLPMRSLLLRSGMSFLLGGILGNVADRIMYGHVIDFLIIGTPNLPSPAFNVADALQWIGYGFIMVALIRDNQAIWPENNVRKIVWINKDYQLKYCFTLMGGGLCFAVIAGVFSYTFLRVSILDLVGNQDIVLKQFLPPFVVTFAAISLCFSIMLFELGRRLSHRAAGPIYAFEKYVNEMLEGKHRNFKLRTKDEFKELEALAHILSERLKEHQSLSSHSTQSMSDESTSDESEIKKASGD